MKRLAVLLALLIPLSVCIAGCGGSSSGGGSAKMSKEDEAKMSAELQQKMKEMKSSQGQKR